MPIAGAVAATLSAAGQLRAAEVTWYNHSRDFRWGTPNNWSPGVLPSLADTALLADFGVGAIDLGGVIRTLSGIELTNTVSAYTVANGTLRLNSVRQAGNAANVITAALETTGSGLGVDSASLTHALSLNGPIAGGGGLRKAGAGTLTLGGASTFTGGVTVEQGTLSFSTDASLGNSSNVVTLLAGSGGGLRAAGTLTSARSIHLDGRGTFDVVGDNTWTISGVVEGHSFRKLGSGTLRFTNRVAAGGVPDINEIREGVVSASGPDGTIGSDHIIYPRGTLELNNSTALGGNHRAGQRLDVHQDIRFEGGTFRLVGADNAASAESIGGIRLRGGAATIQLAAGAGGTARLTFQSPVADTPLLRNPASGSTLDISAAGLGAANKVILLGRDVAPGPLEPWLTANGRDFAKYDAVLGVLPLAEADYSRDFRFGSDVKAAATFSSAEDELFSTLNLDASTRPVSIELAESRTLTLTRGGLLKSGPHPATISSPLLTAGVGELIVHSYGGVWTSAGRSSGRVRICSKVGQGNSSSAVPRRTRMRARPSPTKAF